MKNEQRQASREIIAIVDAHHNYRIGNFEFDHTERTETRDRQRSTSTVSHVMARHRPVVSKLSSINDRGYRLI